MCNTIKSTVLLFVLSSWGLASFSLPASAEAIRNPVPLIIQVEAFRITYDVPLVPQFTSMSCWAAGIAMLVSWRDEISISPEKIAEPLSYKEQYNKDGMDPEDTAVIEYWDLVCEQPQTFTVEGFKKLLETSGPLWVATHELGPHVRVVTGMYGDGTSEGTYLMINDPSPVEEGDQYEESYFEFVRKQSNLANDQLFTLKLAKPIYVVHCKKQLVPHGPRL